jgi:DNA-binding response OmpR family regulator
MNRNRTIIFVGANEILADVARTCLTNAGYTVIMTKNTEEGLAAVAQTPPALVIVDTEPGKGELASPRILRDAVNNNSVPVVALTRIPDEMLARALQTLGISSLIKPITPESLLMMVDEEIDLTMTQSSVNWTTPAAPSTNPDLSDDLISLLVFDEFTPALDAVYERLPDLELKMATTELSPESVALLDLFDGKRRLREIVTQYPKLEKKILFLATYLLKTDLLKRA